MTVLSNENLLSSKFILFLILAFFIFLPSLHAEKGTTKFAKTIDDDDVREAIHVACKSKNELTMYNCNIALAPYLLHDSYSQLFGPPSCHCDRECPLPLALVCATKVTDCIDHCKDLHCEQCKECLMNKDHHDCCPCLAYGVGLVHNRSLGKKVCNMCERKKHHVCDHPPCDQCKKGETCEPEQKLYHAMHDDHDFSEGDADESYEETYKPHKSWSKHNMRK